MTAIYVAILWFLSSLGMGVEPCPTFTTGLEGLSCRAPQTPSGASHAKAEATGEYVHDWGMSADFVDTTSDEPISNGF